MRIYVPAPDDPVIAAIGLAAGGLTLFALVRVLRAGKPQPGVAKFSKALAVLAVLLCAACVAGALAAWRDLSNRPGADPAGLYVLAGGAVLFLWGTIEALTRRLEWDAEGFRLHRFARPPLAARWDEIERVGVAPNQVQLDLKGPRPRRVALSSFLVGLQGFVSEAAQRSPQA